MYFQYSLKVRRADVWMDISHKVFLCIFPLTVGLTLIVYLYLFIVCISLAISYSLDSTRGSGFNFDKIYKGEIWISSKSQCVYLRSISVAMYCCLQPVSLKSEEFCITHKECSSYLMKITPPHKQN